MSFATAFALLIGVLVVAPALAHLLRRKQAEAQEFPPAALLLATPPAARRRSYLEDRGLFSLRVAQVLAMALLGASPFVSCNKLALTRKSGASVALAIVLDDSLSMKIAHASGKSRFEIAQRAALDLVQSLDEGDAVYLVLAGAPNRNVHFDNLDRNQASKAIRAVVASDRATDLDGALSLANDLTSGAVQQDRRIVLFSDLADGRTSELVPPAQVAFWAPVHEIVSAAEMDCGVVSASRSGRTVTATVACSPGAKPENRKVELWAADTKLAEVAASGSVRLELPAEVNGPLAVKLSGQDVLAADDAAPVADGDEDFSIAVIADPAKNRLDTGGPPPIEQAFDALGMGAVRRSLAGAPDSVEDAKRYAGMIFDDPPGFPPEQRRVLASYLDQGGDVMLALGTAAASAQLGYDFIGLLEGTTHWVKKASTGVDPARCGIIGPTAASWTDIVDAERTVFDPKDYGRVLCPFTDGDPLLLRKDFGAGRLHALALPFGVEHSDLPLRPAFLALIDGWVSELRMRGAGSVANAGQVVEAPRGASKVTYTGMDGSGKELVSAEPRDEAERFELSKIGRYEVQTGQSTVVRYARLAPSELDLRPRPLNARAIDNGVGGRERRVDISSYIAVILMALFFAELAIRAAKVRTMAPQSIGS